MRKNTKFLLDAIKKWENIIDNNGYDWGAMNCPLCKEYRKNYVNHDCTNMYYRCDGCPVKEDTRRDGCGGTPYIKWNRHHEKYHYNLLDFKIKCDKCKELAIEELKYLIWLLVANRVI